MLTAVITGCNSGIGNALAQILIAEGYDVYACDIEVGAALQALPCRLHRLDICSPELIRSFAEQVADKPIDVLLNVAGVAAPPAQDNLETVNTALLLRTFETNAFGPLLLTQALIPNLLRSQSAKVGIVSSRMGSIGDNSTSGMYAYRASKAALNSFGKNLAIDLAEKGIVVSLLHPGMVRSNILPAEELLPESIEPHEAASKLWATMQSKEMADTGKFWHRDGHELPW